MDAPWPPHIAPPDVGLLRIGPVPISPPIVLAPMQGVTEICFRRLVRRFGGVGLTCSELVAAATITGRSRRFREVSAFDPDERPVCLQIVGRDPARMAEAARLVEDRGASIVDINMGCPSKRVCAHSGGAALMKDPALAARIVRAVFGAVRVPVTVKMRSGFDDARRNAPELARICQEEGASAVTIHWRTQADGYGGVRSVGEIAEAVSRVSIPVVGNGDIVDVSSACAMLRDTGCAGIMIGRGAIAAPWLPSEVAAWLSGTSAPTLEPAEKCRVILTFLEMAEAELRSPGGVLGRVKLVARQVARALPDGEALALRAVRSPTAAVLRRHIEEYISQAPRSTAPERA